MNKNIYLNVSDRILIRKEKNRHKSRLQRERKKSLNNQKTNDITNLGKFKLKLLKQQQNVCPTDVKQSIK